MSSFKQLLRDSSDAIRTFDTRQKVAEFHYPAERQDLAEYALLAALIAFGASA
jgi:hypothetical protein